MDEEISKQEEARRILDAIRHKEVADGEDESPAKPISHIAEEDANQLKALIAHKLKLTEEEIPAIDQLPDPENIDPISAEQIKVMRKVATITEKEKKPFKETFIDGIIKLYFDFADSFRLKTLNQRSCFKLGHECIHCGKKIPFAALEHYRKIEKEKSADGNKTSAASEKKSS